jgi:TatD DNase family protein
MTNIFDIHTHNADAPANAFINLPMDVLEDPMSFRPVAGRQYSAGIFPLFAGDWDKVYRQLETLSSHSQLKAIGECGLDRRSEISLAQQTEYYKKQAELAVSINKPLIIHCVGCWSELMAAYIPSSVPFIVHGFRGKPQLAEQLLKKGFSLSFGPLFNPQSLMICPPERYYMETDANQNMTINQVAQIHSQYVTGQKKCNYR